MCDQKEAHFQFTIGKQVTAKTVFKGLWTSPNTGVEEAQKQWPLEQLLDQEWASDLSGSEKLQWFRGPVFGRQGCCQLTGGGG